MSALTLSELSCFNFLATTRGNPHERAFFSVSFMQRSPVPAQELAQSDNMTSFECMDTFN